MLFIQGCSLVPVFEGDYLRNQGEIKNQLEDTKKKISENAGMIYTSVASEKEVATVLTSEHAKRTSDWANKPVEFTKPSQGMDMMNMIMTVLLGASGLGGLGAIKKISYLKDTVKTVAGMDSESGLNEARKRGVAV